MSRGAENAINIGLAESAPGGVRRGQMELSPSEGVAVSGGRRGKSAETNKHREQCLKPRSAWRWRGNSETSAHLKARDEIDFISRGGGN